MSKVVVHSVLFAVAVMISLFGISALNPIAISE